MKLSEAIRLGAMQLPEVHGPVFDRAGDGRICGACALGAALYAVGTTTSDEINDALMSGVSPALPLLQLDASHPIHGRDQDVVSIIVGLFEAHKWTREAIADWVQTIEAQQDASTVVQPQEQLA